MCGIFGYVGNRKNAPKLVFKGLKSLEYRGYDSWGVAVVSGDKIAVKKKAGKIGDSNVNDLPNGTLAFGHTRWATHGGVTDANAHPHLDCAGTLAVIHNGIFENYEDFKKKLIKKGHKFVSETDTEVIAHMLEESGNLRKVFRLMEGLAAGELKHGPLALVEKDIPCIAFLPNDETYGANLAGAMEMKARGGFIIGISFKPHEVFDYYIPVRDAGEASIIPNVVAGQLLSYYLSVLKGPDPDKPRNLAKSVTVK